jgi:hypothetical protein
MDGVPRAVPETDVFAFRAAPLTAGSRQRPGGSAELSLVFDVRGIEISGPRPGEQTIIPWASVTQVSRGPSEAAPGRGSVTVIGIESQGRIMRFAVSSDFRDPVELRALSDRVARWSSSAGGPGAGPGFPPVAWPAPPLGPAGASYPADARTGLPTSVAPPRDYWPPGPFAPAPFPPGGRHRTRRIGVLVVALVFLASGIGLAIALWRSSGPPTAAVTHTPAPTADQALADRLMLTRSDLPPGWSVSTNNSQGGSSPKVRAGEARITRTFARCMGITDSQAMGTLGGGATDQTAQTSSPLFVGPPSPDQNGLALELQTAASIVRSHRDEQSDFALFANPRYPQCAGAAFASETQLGADSSSDAPAQAGQTSASVVDVPAPPGDQVSGLLIAFSVSVRSVSVPVEIETIAVGHDRIEANLQVVAIGGQIPPGALTSPLSVFADRVAGGGKAVEA